MADNWIRVMPQWLVNFIADTLKIVGLLVCMKVILRCFVCQKLSLKVCSLALSLSLWFFLPCQGKAK